MAIVRFQARRGAACLALLALAACARQGEDKMGWAQAALERNERLEVVAADPHSGTFTVRVKDTGELRMVRADQLIPGPSFPATAPAASKVQPQISRIAMKRSAEVISIVNETAMP